MSEDIVGVEYRTDREILEDRATPDDLILADALYDRLIELRHVEIARRRAMLLDLVVNVFARHRIAATLTPEPSAAVDLEGVGRVKQIVDRREEELRKDVLRSWLGHAKVPDTALEEARGWATVGSLSLKDLQAVLNAIPAAAHTNRGEVERLREAGRKAPYRFELHKGPMNEASISVIARAVRASLRSYGHKVAESSLPECIAADVAKALRGEAARAALSSPDTVKDVSDA